ncbi:hypothetical protein L3i22_070460 [Actinoplanes sp. L3-i22]|nr:hypothetical protein L3i22_070460 [Actinoplanes sp. L3-i22]
MEPLIEELSPLLEQARVAGARGDRAALREVADRIRLRVEQADHLRPGDLEWSLDGLGPELDPIYDTAFPPGAGDVVELLTAPWPTARRKKLLAVALRRDYYSRVVLDEVAERALADVDLPVLRAVLLHRFGVVQNRGLLVRVLATLHEHGQLDERLIDRAFVLDQYLGLQLFAGPLTPFVRAVRDRVDALVWQLVTGPHPVAPSRLPFLPPRGLRWVRLAMGWSGDAATAAGFGAAALTDEERAELFDLLRDRTPDEQRRVYAWRLRAGDADALVPLAGLDASARLVRLVRGMPENDAFRQDRADLLAAIEAAGLDTTRRFLQLQPNEMVAAVLGDNRAAVLKRVKNNALQGIAAYGMMPLAPGESVLDRYLALRASAKKGVKLGPNRRHSHAAAIGIALDHLAQVTGFPDASRLEWDCEARLVSDTPTSARAGDYDLALRFDGADPVLTVSRGGKALKSVPAAVRADPAYQELRDHQELLRDQARRMRTGLVESLVATSGSLQPEELARLRTLPAGAAMLPALLWRDHTGTIGLLDDVDTTGPVTAVHPVELLDRGLLAHWQREIVHRRLRQPVRQAFREVYVLTPAEQTSVDVSYRFDGQTVHGKVAAQLLSSRGWSLHGEYGQFGATRPAGDGLVAGLRCDMHGYFGMGDVVVHGLSILRGAVPMPLAEVPAAVFSEVMRDLDLAVSVAGTEPYGSATQAESRAQVLAALITDLGLERVTVEGTSAVVRGGRATYRVHLTSGSIHVEPGGYLCVVPAGFGSTGHRRLFLPFADEDRMTSVILSKVLLLAEDEKITDPSIVAQLERLMTT